MEKIIFGDNQFFGVNHLSDERALQQVMKFQRTEQILDILDFVSELGIKAFMCTTYSRVNDICDHIRREKDRYRDFRIYPCLPYGHKYNNAVAELGMVGAARKMLPGNVIGTAAKGSMAFLQRNYINMMKMLVDAELAMFERVDIGPIFLQNVITDLILGLGMYDFFIAYYEYIKEKYHTEPGFITMNLPVLLPVLESLGIDKPIICASINKIGFRMPGGMELYEKIIAEERCRLIAMQTLAAGALSPDDAVKYISDHTGIHSILFGASTRSHIRETKELIELYSEKTTSGSL